MLTSWPRAAAPVAITKAARTRSRSPEKTIKATMSSGCDSSRLSTRCSTAASRSISSFISTFPLGVVTSLTDILALLQLVFWMKCRYSSVPSSSTVSCPRSSTFLPILAQP